MDWATRRKWFVLSILIAIGVATVAIISFALWYEVPTCTDQTQNQDEEGIDCGGSCTTVCTMSARTATVRFARALQQSGRTDLIAYIDNPNQNAAAPDTRMVLDVYSEEGRSVQTDISVDIPAGATVPVYLPGIAYGAGTPRQAFLMFAEGFPLWKRASTTPAVSVVSNIQIENTAQPRVTATLVNQTAYVHRNIPLIVSIFDAAGMVIAASQTIVPTLPPQGTAPVSFTWNEPFTGVPVRVEVVPVASLPQVVP